MSKKTLITAAATATLVASIGFAYAQSTDEEAYPRANINGQIDNSTPKHWARDQVNVDPYDTAAPTAAGPSTTPPADTTTSATATPSATDANSPWAADSTSTPATTPSGTTSSYDATTTATTTAPANTTDSVNQTNGSLSTNVAPETHVDLNSPNDPIYNMGRSSDERAPRPDRN